MSTNQNLPAGLPNLIAIQNYEKLNCPDCQIHMRAFKCEHIIVYKCEKCNGIWFDDKELGVFRNSLNKYDLSRIEVSYYPSLDAGYRVSICPRCEDALVETTYAYNSNVKLCRCIKCQGIWLPAAEFITLVELSKLGQAVAQDAKGFAKEYKLERLKLEKQKNISEWNRIMQGPRALSLFYPMKILYVLVVLIVRAIILVYEKIQKNR